MVNNIFSPEKHYVNVDFFATGVMGKPINGEPEKIGEIGWFDLDNLPQPVMLPTENLFKEFPELITTLKMKRSFTK